MGFVPHMRVPCMFYVNDQLQQLLFDELEQYVSHGDTGGFLPAVKQLANVAALPGIVKASIALPDVHSGYGFAIGNVAAFDMSDPEAIVSPGMSTCGCETERNGRFVPNECILRLRWCGLRHQLRCPAPSN